MTTGTKTLQQQQQQQQTTTTFLSPHLAALQRLYEQGAITKEEWNQILVEAAEEDHPLKYQQQTELLVPFPQQAADDKEESSNDIPNTQVVDATATTEATAAANHAETKTAEKGSAKKNPLVDYVRKGAVAVVGGTMVGVGLVMVPLPTPFGAVVAGGGMAVLGTEFEQVKDTNDKILNRMIQGIEALDDDPAGSQSNSCAIEEEEEQQQEEQQQQQQQQPTEPCKKSDLAKLATRSKKAVSSFLCENVLPFLRTTRGEYTQAMSKHQEEQDDDDDDDSGGGGIREIKLLQAQGIVQVKQL